MENRDSEYIIVHVSPQDTYVPLHTLSPVPWDQGVQPQMTLIVMDMALVTAVLLTALQMVS